MKLDKLCLDIKNRRLNGQTYQSIASHYNLTRSMVYQIERGYKPGKKISSILNLDPEPGLISTRKRREILNEIAKSWGYASWCSYETSIIKSSNTG